jgi:hypothetical protein
MKNIFAKLAASILFAGLATSITLPAAQRTNDVTDFRAPGLWGNCDRNR